MLAVNVDAQESRKLEFLEKQAANGEAVAQYELGRVYANGENVHQDFSRAYQLFLSSAQQGYQPAAMALSKMYSFGDGVSRDLAEADRWRRKATDRGRLSVEDFNSEARVKSQVLPQARHTRIELSTLFDALLPTEGQKYVDWADESTFIEPIEWSSVGVESSEDVRFGTFQRVGKLVLFLSGKPAFTRLGKSVEPGEWDLTLHGMRWGYSAITLSQVLGSMHPASIDDKILEKQFGDDPKIIKECNEGSGYTNLYSLKVRDKATVWVEEMHSCGTAGCNTTFTVQFDEQSGDSLQCLFDSEEVLPGRDANTTARKTRAEIGKKVSKLPTQFESVDSSQSQQPINEFSTQLNKECVNGRLMEVFQNMALSKSQEREASRQLPSLCKCFAETIAKAVPDPNDSVRDALLSRIAVRKSISEIWREKTNQRQPEAVEYSVKVWTGAAEICIGQSAMSKW